MCAWYGREAAEDRTYRSQLARELLAKRGHPPSAQSGAPGHVVEFLKSGGPLCGAVLRRGRHGDRVLDARGKPDFVPHDRIIDTSAAFVNPQMARHEIVQTLRSIDRERDRLKATIDPYELWEVVESEAQEWTLDELAALYFPGEPGRVQPRDPIELCDLSRQALWHGEWVRLQSHGRCSRVWARFLQHDSPAPFGR